MITNGILLSFGRYVLALFYFLLQWVMLLQKSINYNIMITATTTKGTKVNVSLCDDVAPNKGGYYCEVYLDGIDDDPIDNFVISKSYPLAR
mgnify:CR=1 FL=1